MKSFDDRTDRKGTNVTSASFLASENGSQRNLEDFPNLQQIKKDMTNVINNIDVMQTPSSSATFDTTNIENDDSHYSGRSYVSSVLKYTQVTKNKEQSSMYNSPRDISEVSAISTSQMESEHYSMINNPPFPPQQEIITNKPLCVPAILPPAVLCMNPECMCSHSVEYAPNFIPQKNCTAQNKRPNGFNKNKRLSNLIQKFKTPKKGFKAKELYEINIRQQSNGSFPQRFVFDRVQEDYKPLHTNIGTNTSTKYGRSKCSCPHPKGSQQKHNSKSQGGLYNQCSYHSNVGGSDKFRQAPYYNSLQENAQISYKNDKDAARVDVYYFDHGNAAYYRTTESCPIILTEVLGEKAENYASKFWAELFGSIYIIFAFITTFILQFLRFLLQSILRPLTIGLFQTLADFFLKPFLAVLFNAIIQPPLIFFYNIATSIRDLCDPIAEGIGYFIREISVICKSIRLFEIRKEKRIKCDNEEKGTQYELKAVSSNCPCP